MRAAANAALIKFEPRAIASTVLASRVRLEAGELLRTLCAGMRTAETDTLDEWLGAVLGDKRTARDYVTYQFPTQAHFDEYISRIHSFTESQVRTLLRHLLLPSGSLGIDDLRYETLVFMRDADPPMYARMMNHSYFQRLTLQYVSRRSVAPWEGITWVLDLLPHWPGDALRALDAYFLAHAQVLPDGRLQGLSDAMGVIRAWYIGVPGSRSERLDALRAIATRDFEHVIHSLYKHMGYEAVLTPPRNDGGRDVIASRTQVGHTESLRVECKRWNYPVGVEYARAILGVVSDEKANKGVLVTCGAFTRGARALETKNSRLELIDGAALVPLLNEHLGTNWPARLDRIILDSRRE